MGASPIYFSPTNASAINIARLGNVGFGTAGALLAGVKGVELALGKAISGVVTKGLAVTGIGALVSVAATVVLQFFKGADPRQVPAAKIEQAFESAAFSFKGLYVAGLITAEQNDLADKALIEAAQREEIGANLGPAATRGAMNAARVITAQILGGRGNPGRFRITDISQATPHYYQWRPGWYKDSIDAGHRIANEIVQQFISNAQVSLAASTPQAQAGKLGRVKKNFAWVAFGGAAIAFAALAL